jgi:hypothetical protein
VAGPPSARGTSWCTWHTLAGWSQPGNAQCGWRLATARRKCAGIAGSVSPRSSGSDGWYAAVSKIGLLLLLAGYWLAFVLRQVLSWRRADGEHRQQLKWLMIGAIMCLAAIAIAILGPVLAPGAPAAAQTVAALSGMLIAGLPVGIGIAILKYRLYEIDRIISRTLAYTIVTGLLVGVYAGLVLLATRVLPFSGSVAVAASTLAVAALFNPLRRRVQAVVDRRFNRAPL